MRDEAELDDALASPSPDLVADMAELDGDLLVLGAGGKMGPSLVRLALRAVAEAGTGAKVIAVSRFGDERLAHELRQLGADLVRADVTDERELAALPDAANVVYMVGSKFGAAGQEHHTWLVNTHLPGRVAERFRGARISAFSTGNVYPLVPVDDGAPTEEHPPGPIGEYAMSCLGRERVLEHFSHRHGTPMAVLRLNYAIDLRYGVLLDIGHAVREGRPVDLAMGHVNVVWQGYANEVALRALRHATSPPLLLNLTGPETLSVRQVAEAFGEHFGVEPVFTGSPAPTALLSNAGKVHALFGYPRVPAGRLIAWTAAWLRDGGPVWDKPTHFQRRDGDFTRRG